MPVITLVAYIVSQIELIVVCPAPEILQPLIDFATMGTLACLLSRHASFTIAAALQSLVISFLVTMVAGYAR